MKKSEEIKELAIALSKFQGEVENPKNIAENPFFRSKYAPLETVLNTVRPILSKHGLSIIQIPSSEGQNVTITTTLIHSSGEWIESVPLSLKMDKVTAQGAGSAITYARRYAVSAILGISSEDDDDGNNAEPKKVPGRPRQQAPVKIGKDKADTLISLVKEKEKDMKVILDFYKVKDINDLTVQQWTKAMEQLKKEVK